MKKIHPDSNNMKEADESLASYNTANQEESMCEELTMTDEEDKNSENYLETAIKSWTKKQQHEYLKSIKEPIHGLKKDLTTRIMAKISIEDAIKITREYKRRMNRDIEDMKGIERKNVVEISEDDMAKMEIILKRKRDENSEHIPNKINVYKDIRVIKLPEKNEKTDRRKDLRTTRAREINKNKNDKEVRKSESSKINTPQENNKLIELETEGEGEIINTSDYEENKTRTDDSLLKKGKTDYTARSDGDSVATTKVDNIKKTRMGLMLTIPASKEPDKLLSTYLQKWFNKMKETDNNFRVISWKTEDGPKQPIKESKYIPNVISKLRVYFARIQVRPSGGKVFTDVLVQHTIPVDDLRGDTEWFMKENKMAMYKKQLQVESTAQMGWFLYSTQLLDNEALKVAIEAEIGVQVALRWKYVNSSKYIDDDAERKKWMALHIEVDSKEMKKASKGLNRLYGSKSKKFPLGIRMRLVSEFREVRGNAIMVGKHSRLRVRQASFISLVEGHPSDDIQMLDYEDEGITLRGLIMDIQSRNPNTPGNLFHAVGKDRKGRIIFNYLRHKAEEARTIVEGLIPYLQHHHGNKVNLFFDPQAVVEKERWKWNEETGTLTSPLSEELDGLETIDDDYDFTVIQTEGSLNEKNMECGKEREGGNNNVSTERPSVEDSALTRLNLVVTGTDTDSVSTLGNPASPATFQKAKLSNMLAIRTAHSGTSSITESSLDTRMTNIEQRISSMEESFTNSLENFMAKLLEKMTSPSQSSFETQLPGGEIAGRQDE